MGAGALFLPLVLVRSPTNFGGEGALDLRQNKHIKIHHADAYGIFLCILASSEVKLWLNGQRHLQLFVIIDQN